MNQDNIPTNNSEVAVSQNDNSEKKKFQIIENIPETIENLESSRFIIKVNENEPTI